MAKILLEVVTPDRVVLSTEADVVVAPGVEGQFGVLFGHVPFLSALEIGEMYYRDGGKQEFLAERRLAMARTENIDWARAEAALRRAVMRMKVAGR